MVDLQTILNLVYTFLFLCITAGGITYFKRSQHKAIQEITRSVTEVQERANNALQSEINTLKDKVSDLEKENTRLKRNLGSLKRLLSKHGVTIQIEGDIVSISDEKGITIESHIQEAS